MVELLERLGHEVVFPEEQTCCGQMHFNTGYVDEATALVRRFARVFAGEEVIVCPSGSCAGMVRDAYPRVAELAGDDGLARDVRALGERVFELSELLVDVLGVEDVGAYYPHRVTYHPTCHSLRLLKVGDKPLRLLRAVRGLELVELDEPYECCGFGGTFAVKNADVSTAMLADKVRHVLDTRAEVCAAADNSCLMHIGGGLARLRTGHADRPPRRDPGGDRVSRTDRVGLPRRGARGARRHPAAPQHRQGDADDPRQARADGRASSATGRRCARPGGRSRSARCATCPSTSSGSRPRSCGPAATSTGRATAPRPARSSRASPRDHGSDEVIKVKSLATDEIGLNDALAERGISAWETDLAELIVQLDPADEQSHILVPAIHRNRAEIRTLFMRTLEDTERADRRAGGARRGRPPAPAAQVPLGAGGHLGRELLHRRDRHGLRRRVRGQRPHVHHAARRCW